MNRQIQTISLFLWSALGTAWAAETPPAYQPSTMEPPGVRREFRGAWIATVNNIDWPSQPGLPVAQQQKELIEIMDRAVRLNLNALVLQVRPACDTIYPSKIEPWSYYLTGTMGKAPEPFYDPLAFAVSEAHQRGLELHAWFSPYRAALLSTKQVFATNHVVRAHPQWVQQYGDVLWLDPGLKEVQDYAVKVVLDVVNRYDIDGVHFDDRLGYPVAQNAKKQTIEFPDGESWRRYVASGGKLNRANWRRDNVSTFVRRVYEAVKAAKPWVKVGIAPPGIWQPGYPQSITGQNAFAVLYVDSLKWLQNGWVDYFSPQLYWAIKPPEHSFPTLLHWWLEPEHNPKHRHVWPGLNAANVGEKWKAEEILEQIQIAREQGGSAAGQVQWSMKCLLQNRGGLAADLANGLYREPALVPPSPWLELKFAAKPKLIAAASGALSWHPDGVDKIFLWVLQTRSDGHWHTLILPGERREHTLATGPDVVALTAIDRCGVASPPVVLQRSSGQAK